MLGAAVVLATEQNDLSKTKITPFAVAGPKDFLTVRRCTLPKIFLPRPAARAILALLKRRRIKIINRLYSL